MFVGWYRDGGGSIPWWRQHALSLIAHTFFLKVIVVVETDRDCVAGALSLSLSLSISFSFSFSLPLMKAPLKLGMLVDRQRDGGGGNTDFFHRRKVLVD